MGNNPSGFKRSNRPVENISWDDAQAFITKLNELQPSFQLCLPSEAQWEYACRAGTETAFYFGDNVTPERGNYNGSYPYNNAEKGLDREKTVDVGSLPINPWGLYEMHGNVWEWCQDYYGSDIAEQQVNPIGVENSDYRVLRGGSWISDGGNCRSAVRFNFSPAKRFYYAGFRLARGHPAQPTP